MRNALVLALLLSACAGTAQDWLRRESVGYVGCDERDISIGNDWHSEISIVTWTATCPGGAVYHCAKRGEGMTDCARG